MYKKTPRPIKAKSIFVKSIAILSFVFLTLLLGHANELGVPVSILALTLVAALPRLDPVFAKLGFVLYFLDFGVERH